MVGNDYKGNVMELALALWGLLSTVLKIVREATRCSSFVLMTCWTTTAR